MRKKSSREPRESALASGWTVDAEATGDHLADQRAVRADGTRIGDRADGGSEGYSEGYEEQADTDAGAIRAAADEPPEPQQISNAALVVLGVFGGLYMLYVWGWLVIARAYSEVNAIAAAGSGSIGGALQQIVFWAAPLAPVLWFVLALAFSRGAKTGRLAILLCVGAVVLLPLPMLIARGG